MGVKATVKVSSESWPLKKRDDMYKCHGELVDKGFRGQVRAWQGPDGAVYDLEINHDNGAQAVALLGQTVVLFDETRLEVQTPEVEEPKSKAK